MKKLDKLVIGQFVGPFILTFCIALFVLVMQLLWKYVDDLVGKGLEMDVLGELLFYASANLVPMATAIAILLSSIMTLGSLGEHYELTSVKSTGISLIKFLRGLTITIIFMTMGTFWFTNFVMPKATLEWKSLMYDIRRQKPALNIKEKIFNNDIDGYSMIVDRKGEDGKTLYNLKIYDHTDPNAVQNVIVAEKGEMLMSDDETTLIFELTNGAQYIEQKDPDPKKSNSIVYRTTFDNYKKHFDLTQFELESRKRDYFKELPKMMNMWQLERQMDTVGMEMYEELEELDLGLAPHWILKRGYYDTVMANNNNIQLPVASFGSAMELLDDMSSESKIRLIQIAMAKARNMQTNVNSASRNLIYFEEVLLEMQIEWHRKITLAVACFVLFLIGAPLGSIIRKGGLGWPFAWAILLFIVYYVLSILGEKLADSHQISVTMGMWLPIIVLTPVGLFLLYKANNDSSLYNSETYRKLLKRFSIKFK